MPVREFRVLKTLGGCGGTIISRALAANGAVVMSEVNPRSAQLFGCGLNPLVQLQANYPDLLPPSWRGVDPHVMGKPELFGMLMADVHDNSRRPLVIRDYSYVDYIGTPFVWPAPERSSLEPALLPYGLIRTVILVRRPSACLRSLLRHGSLASTLSIAEYIDGHIAFMERNVGVPIMRFEEFLADRVGWMQSLSGCFSIPYDPTWEERLADAPGLTGNARAISSSQVSTVDDPIVDADYIPDELRAEHARLLRLCGYDPETLSNPAHVTGEVASPARSGRARLRRSASSLRSKVAKPPA